MPTHTILTVCVNYRNDEETASFVRQLLAQRGGFDQSVIVVDNSETPLVGGPLHSLGNEYRNTRLYIPTKNLGYYGGAALGLREYIKICQLPAWIIVCNTDIEMQPAFLSAFCDLYPADHHASHHAIIAPSIYSTLSGMDQNPYMQRRPSAARMHFYKWIFRYYHTFSAYQTLALAKQKVVAAVHRRKSMAADNQGVKMAFQPGPRPIYAPHGSFVVFHRSYFEAGGSLDHGAFLFGEEVFVAETARRLGLTVTYDPRLLVLHREHAATAVLKDRQRFLYVREASGYCADEFFSRL